MTNTAATASSTNQMKDVPNGWIFKLVDNSNSDFVKVEDLGTQPMGDAASIGFIPRSNACFNIDRKNEFENKSKLVDSTSDADKATRKGLLVDAIENFYNNGDMTTELYSAAGGSDGNNNFGQINIFPGFRQAMLAVADLESGGSRNNRVCSGDKLGGLGLVQITSQDSKGLGSNLTRVLSTVAKNYFDDC